ncbi:MAG TPA: tetratricopeptide repeat protein, partial [Candidatus Eremiobacteraceae bacterium]|nr:tetratricopeptide repeat protein [Candidatus Eremiobacteraceae bacterium]
RFESGARKFSQGAGAPTMAKTPSGFDSGGDRTMDGGDAGTLYGADETPGPAVTPRSSSVTPSGASSFSGGLQPGMEFGPRFRIEKLLGEGGMGKVYKAYDKELERIVALKTLQPELVSDPNVTLRFKQELLLASRISHRNILRIHDLSEVGGVKYITMAFIEGKDLNQVLKEERPFPLERALHIGRQLCEALDAAHVEGVVHRDFKPHNVLVAKNDQVYVSDFGLATSLESAKMGMTRTGAFVGTPRYMSPEQVEGGTVDSRSDLYSLGLVLYEMVAGDVPFSGDSTWQVMYQRVKERPKDLKALNPQVPDNVARTIMHCLEKNPADRYQTAREILADLDAGRSPSLSLAQSIQRSMPRVDPRWKYAAIGAAVFAVILFFSIPKTRHLVFHNAPATVAGGANPAVPGLPSLAQGKFMAVLPFRVLGDQSSLGYVAEGLGEALSAKLFQLKDIRVASAAAAAKTDPKTPLPEVAKELGVNLILHGTVQGSADNLRVTVNLENVAENRLILSQEFPGVTGDLLTIEDKIYGRLVDALESKPSTDEMAAATAHPTENVEAYNEYLKGRNALSGGSDQKNVQVAINFFSAALQKDPGFALAYSGLADANLLMYEEKKDSFYSEKAVEAAKQAARLNDKLPEVHFSLGSAYRATGQTAQSITELKKAMELAPNSDESYRRLGNSYIANGQKDEAIKALEKAAQINPYYWNNLAALGNAYLSFGESDKAVKTYKQVIEIDPNNPEGYSNLGAVYFSMGKYDEGIAALQKSLLIKPAANTYSNLGTAFFYLKRYPEALSMFQKAVEMSPDDETNVGNLADGYRWSGNPDQARATYEKAIALAYKEMRVNPRNAEVAGHLALYYAKKGDPAQASNFIKKARSMDKSTVYLIYISAVVNTIANKPSDAVNDLRLALEKGYSAGDIQSDPEFAPLQTRPDYQSLLKKYAAKAH